MSEDFSNIEKPTTLVLEVRTKRRKLAAEMEIQGLSEIDILDDIVEYSKLMKAKYPDTFRKVRAYHALVGSSIPGGKTDLQDDFPGEDSVLVFLDQLREKHLKKKDI